MRKLILFLLLFCSVAGAATEKLALVGGTVVTATGTVPIENSLILIENGQINYIGIRDSVISTEQYRTIDVTGKWITPGLIDSNIHLILTTVPEFFVKYEDRLTDIAIQSAQVGLKYGLTTMPDTWGPLKPLLEARDRINRGEFVGSRVLVAGNIIGTGGPFSQYFMGGWSLHGLSTRYGGWVHPSIQRRINALWEDEVGPVMLAMTPAEAAETLRNYIAKGVDFVKVGVSGHSLGRVEPLMFSPAVLRAMREEVRKAGIPFTTHTFTVESLRLAVELEPDLLVHPNVMSVPWSYASPPQQAATRSLIKSIADKGIFAGLMAVPEKTQMQKLEDWDASEHSDAPYLNKIILERKQGMSGVTYEERAAGIKVWLNGGVRFTLATDQGPESADLGPTVWGRLGRMHFDRMIGLQDAGAKPMDILIAATRNGAEAYGLGDKLGTVEVGKLADLLVLDADPLSDIGNFRRINMVIKEGQIIDRDALPSVRVLDYDPEAPWPF
jgi:imidazolonepropionase-like amidohydrolase